MTPALDAKGKAVARALVRWFRHAHRDLPWRRTRDPYAIWVSEIMLQQTRVEAVVPHYERFLARFPTVHALAGAPPDDVLHAWSGLGYYRRARQLHAAAATVVREHAGALPSDEAALRALPGVGRYTAGAIRSIAFGAAAPVVDGNAGRVLSRVHALRGGPGGARRERRLWELAAALVARTSDPGALNQALMELGATVCTPRAPRCAACPLARQCAAHARGREEAFPPPRERTAPRRLRCRAVVRVRAADGAVLMRQRGEGETNAGQWEVPLLASGTDGAAPRGARRLGMVRHGILDTSYEVEAFARAHRGAGRSAPRGGRWITPRERAALPLTTLTRKILGLLD